MAFSWRHGVIKKFKALAFFLYVFFSLNPSAQRIEQKHRCIEHHREVIEKDNRQPATPCLWFYRQRPWKFSMQDTSKYLQRFESYTYSIKKTVQGIIYVCSEPTALVKQNIFWKTLIEVCSSPHLYASFCIFCVQIGQLIEAQENFVDLGILPNVWMFEDSLCRELTNLDAKWAKRSVKMWTANFKMIFFKSILLFMNHERSAVKNSYVDSYFCEFL